ncbi:DUF3604 domain-containing protein [Aestuariimicrobium soli]|uniref:DUF3604 domain-containing protein n=1 Tax=Aestuariimicrobium soli TaxID=2035834 RepID=UPI003EBE78E7
MLLASLRTALHAYLTALDEGRASAELDAAAQRLVPLNLFTVDEAGRAAALDACATLEAAAAEPAADDLAGDGLALVQRPLTGELTAHSPAVSWSADGGLRTDWLTFAGGGTDRPELAPVLAGRWRVGSLQRSGEWVVEVTDLDDVSAAAERVGREHAIHPTAAVDREGRLHVVTQENHDGHWVLVHHVRAGGPGSGWSEPLSLTLTTENSWDPCLVADDSGLWLVWVAAVSEAGGRRFVPLVRRFESGGSRGGRWLPAERVPLPTDGPGESGTGQALHPSACVDASGRLWIVCDLIDHAGLGLSGPTASTPTERLRGSGVHLPSRGYSISTRIAVVARADDGSGWGAPAGVPVVEQAAATHPRLACTPDGGLVLVHRTMRQLPLRNFVTHLVVRTLGVDGWSGPSLVPHSGAGDEGFAVASTPGGVAIVHADERYRDRLLTMFERPDEPSTSRDRTALPSLDRMGTGGHRGTGAMLLTEVRPVAEPEAVLVPLPAAPAAGQGGRGPSGQGLGSSVPPTDGIGTDGIVWGDLHRHSNISRCAAGLDISTADHHRLAQDVLGLDFWALTDHSENTSDASWHQLQTLANAHLRPGHHVPLLAYEWTSFTAGHVNVVFDADSAPLLASSDPRTDTPPRLWETLEREVEGTVLTIPHHPAALPYSTDWTYHHDRFVRLVEVFQSATGSYESDWCPRQHHDAVAPRSTVADGLAAGRRLGFIASNDHRNGAAYLGVRTDELTRGGVMRALDDRRCFAATRRGIVPTLEVDQGVVRFGGDGAGVELAAVELISDVGGSGGAIVASSRDGGAGVPVDVRLWSAQDGPRLWSGSLTVEAPGRVVPAGHWPVVVASVDDHRVVWEAALPDPYAGVWGAPGVIVLGATIEGPDETEVTVEAAGRRVVFRLGDLRGADAGVLTDGRDAGELAVRRGSGGLDGLGASTWASSVPVPARSGCWYYTRVTRVDGEMAWSSPVWLE